MLLNIVAFGLISIFIHSAVITSHDMSGPFVPKIPREDYPPKDIVYTGGPATKPPISIDPEILTETTILPTTKTTPTPTITFIIGPLCLSREALDRCNGNPCDTAKCPAYPNAKCRPNFCDGACKAEFYQDLSLINNCKLVQEPSPCPPGVPIVNCFVDPCQFAKCPAYPKALCQSNFCGGCNADFFVAGKKVNCDVAVTGPTNPCPPGVPLVNCLVDPCTVSKCPAFPNAICHSNYCGGCNADFYVKNQIVNCNTKPPIPQKCPPGVPIFKCIVDPCTVSKCCAYPKAICKANYCGGCNAEFFINNIKVDCKPKLPTPKPKPLCPPGVRIFNCFVDPCMLAKCPAFPKAICRSNYCGGCFADFYVANKKVNCKSPSFPTAKPKSLCPPGVPLVNCLSNPCLNAKCPAYPKAICRANYCGGCNADFYVGTKKVECELDTTVMTTHDPDLPCPPGTPIVDCARDPCTMAECPAFPAAICKPNFCTGCHAYFYVNGVRVDCTLPNPGGCPPGVPLVQCKADPCTVTKCPLYPKAICKANYCGGCYAEYYVKGKRVQCEKEKSEGMINNYVIY